MELRAARAAARRRVSAYTTTVTMAGLALLVLAAVATMARPTRVAPPVAPTASIDDTTSGDLRLAGLARGGVAR
jgi:hypothetical protein